MRIQNQLVSTIESNQGGKRRLIKILSGGLVIASLVALLYILSLKSYPIYHSIAELLSIIVASGLFFIVWNSYRRLKNHFFLILATGVIASALFDTLHLFAYRGVDIISVDIANPSNLATQLWLVARFLQSTAFLIAAFFIQKKIRPWILVALYLLISIGFFLSIFYFENFPVAFIEGHGLTLFKIASEYTFCAILAIAAYFIYRKKKSFDKDVYTYVVLSILTSVFSGLAFTLYDADVYDIYNFIGHALKIVAYYFLNQAVVVTYISRPQDLLYRELQSSEKSLQRSEARLRENTIKLERDKDEDEAILKGIGSGMVALNSDGVIQFTNEAFEKMFDLPKVKIAGKVITEIIAYYDEKNRLVPKSKQPLVLVITSKKKSAIKRDNLHIFRKNGTRMDVSIVANPIISRGRVAGAVGIFSDITKAKRVEKTRMEYISFVAHQFRTPLSSIGLTAEFALKNIKKGTGNTNSYLSEIIKQSSVLAQMVDTFLSVTKIESGMLKIEPILSSLTDIIEDKTREMHGLISEKKIIIIKKLNPKFPRVKIDIKLMSIILDNLLSNAIKYTPKGGDIIIEVKKIDRNFIIKVEDSGFGIPQEEQNRVYDKMFRATNTSRSEGSGLGLYIVRLMVEQSGGKIWFKSPTREGEFFEKTGTAFYVSYPMSGMKTRSKQSS